MPKDKTCGECKWFCFEEKLKYDFGLCVSDGNGFDSVKTKKPNDVACDEFDEKEGKRCQR